MCRVTCPKCRKTTETPDPAMCYFVGRLKYYDEVKPGFLRGRCPKCGHIYTVGEPPTIHLCPHGDAGYEKAKNEREYSERVRRMNKPFGEKIKEWTEDRKAHARKLA